MRKGNLRPLIVIRLARDAKLPQKIRPRATGLTNQLDKLHFSGILRFVDPVDQIRAKRLPSSRALADRL
jgi:hypothetical protein